MNNLKNIDDDKKTKDSNIQNWTIVEIVIRYKPKGWEKVFDDAKYELADISRVLENDEKVNGYYFPFKRDIFKAFELTPLEKVRWVLIGQDPYAGISNDGNPQAVGLSFSVNRGVTIPPSLRNIFKEINDSISDFKLPNHGDLTKWALQGCLLLNMSLSVRPKTSKSHDKIWLSFNYRVLQALADYYPKCIYLLLGKDAQEVEHIIHSRGRIFKAAHPSPLSANRGGFFGCQHFATISELLDNDSRGTFDWNLD